ncbi:MAG TPA: Na+/H+ antiporter NhaA [Anaerolineales bacterium]|nr:Na+/H+ antiporter NhaA [Anaerolineales bacterium]
MTLKTTSRLKVPVTREDRVLGPSDASVVFVEYGDYECPYCLQASSIVQEIKDRLGDRIRYVFRHFPIRTSHPNALKAAEAAEAAAAQGKFWEMHEVLFAHQGALDRDHLIQYAGELGLDVERFREELDGEIYREKVEEQFRGGVRSGVNGTPTFFINGVRYEGPWDVESLFEQIEKPLGVQVRNLFQRFTRLQAAGGMILLAATLAALFLANSPLAEAYHAFWRTELSIQLGPFSLSHDLLYWVNDGLMVLFFFVVGLEIKREITIGELASPRRAALPAMAAIGGMLVPAAAYLLLNQGTPTASGWAVPMATDIAFSLGILALLGRRVPIALRVFFTALAIVDDIGAVLVIALFYSGTILWVALLAGAVVFGILLLLNWQGVRNPLPYAILGVLLWLAFLESGVHPTIAGVLLALTIPARSKLNLHAYQAQCVAILGGRSTAGPGTVVEMSDNQQAAAQALEAMAERMQTPALRLEYALTPWATYLVLPVFALANAGVTLRGNLALMAATPVFQGIVLGLLIGKPLGVAFFTWLAVRLRIADLPARVGWPQLLSATFLAGVGFTMALFIAGSAFEGAALETAKAAILIGSGIVAVIGAASLSLTSRERDQVSGFAGAPAVAAEA